MHRVRHGCRRSLLLFAAILLAGCAELTPPPPESAAKAPPPAAAPARVSGTLTVGTETSALRHGYAARERDPRASAQEYLVVLLADRPIAAADRRPSRLSALARSGQLRGLRLVRRQGSDDVAVALYHPQIVERSSPAMRSSLSALMERRAWPRNARPLSASRRPRRRAAGLGVSPYENEARAGFLRARRPIYC